MPSPKNKTRKRDVHPVGVAERLKDAPPTHYVPTGANRPGEDDTYTLDGVEHLWIGKCHDECENLR